MGVMIIPMVASLSEDAMSSVPNAMREGALALGATKLEVTWKVVIPAAIIRDYRFICTRDFSCNW